MAARLPASTINELMGCNGLAKFRGRLKQLPYQNAK